MLGCITDSVDVGEIFTGHVNYDLNFWKYLGSRQGDRPEFICPHFWYDAWEDYIEHISKRFHSTRIVADLKIDCLAYVLRQNFFSVLHEREPFFSGERVKVIFLSRENLLAQVVSRKIAEVTRVWGRIRDGVEESTVASFVRQYSTHQDTNEGSKNPVYGPTVSITLDPEDLYRDMVSAAAANDLAYEVFKQLPTLKLTYESLFAESGYFNQVTLNSLAEFIGVDTNSLASDPILQKQAAADFLSPIANANDIRSFMGKTVFSWMLPDIRS